MKKLLLLGLLFIGLPTFANVEICNNEYCRDYRENIVQSIETTENPNYGVIVRFKDGGYEYIQANTRASAVLMLNEGYESLKDYYNWSDNYFYNMLEKQDKAGLGIR